MGFHASETIALPREKVWVAATDWSRASEWMKGIEKMHAIDPGPVGPGSRLAFQSRGSEHESTVVGWQVGQSFALRSKQGGMTADYVYHFEKYRGGTNVTLDADCRGEGLGWRIVTPLIGLLMARADSGQIRALKEMLEAHDDDAN
jgi:hypothetical protein